MVLAEIVDIGLRCLAFKIHFSTDTLHLKLRSDWSADEKAIVHTKCKWDKNKTWWW